MKAVSQSKFVGFCAQFCIYAVDAYRTSNGKLMWEEASIATYKQIARSELATAAHILSCFIHAKMPEAAMDGQDVFTALEMWKDMPHGNRRMLANKLYSDLKATQPIKETTDA